MWNQTIIFSGLYYDEEMRLEIKSEKNIGENILMVWEYKVTKTCICMLLHLSRLFTMISCLFFILRPIIPSLFLTS